MKYRIHPAGRLLATLILPVSVYGWAETSPGQQAEMSDYNSIQEIRVWGRSIDLIGNADSASDGLVGYEDFSTRPLLRVGEMVEVVPGMIATQHSGGGKANQYFLRGINLDHGTDFSIEFEGMPANMRTHAHGQGYLDMNFIIPEMIETIEYHKGTYHADIGDFSAAGATKFKTYDQLKRGFGQLTWGSEDYQRAVVADSWSQGGDSLLMAGEVERKDGPWDNPEDVKKYNLFAKYSTEVKGSPAYLLGTYYDNTWNSTDQIPLRAVESGAIDRFGFVDSSTGGQSKRANLIAGIDTGNTGYHAFLSYYELNLFSNGTYFMADPVNGDQIEQEDQRWIAGGSVDNELQFDWSGRDSMLTSGLDFRYDHINKLNLFNTAQRHRIGTVRSDQVWEASLGAYTDLQVHWTDRLRTNFGLRADIFSWDVDALRPENAGSGSDYLLAPKFGLAYQFNDALELYANWGRGFHSNDVRAVELSTDPATGDPAEPFEAIVKALGYEAGFRAEPNDSINFSMSLFYLELDSELVFVGDAGTTEPKGGTERYGVETALFWQPTDWFTLDLTAAKTRGRFTDAPSGEDKIPDAHDFIVGAGATITLANSVTGSLRVRHFGDAPLAEDGSVEKGGTTLVNLGVSREIGSMTLGIDVLNLLDEEASDIEYLYESQLPGEPSPVEDIHFHPVEPREVRLHIRYSF